MSPYQIEEIVLLAFGGLNNKEGEENNEETETLHQEGVQDWYERYLVVFKPFLAT